MYKQVYYYIPINSNWINYWVPLFQGGMKGQLVGPLEFRGMNLTQDEFEFLLGKTGAIETKIKEDPKPKVYILLGLII